MKSEISLGDTKLLAAVREMLEDRMRDVIEHMKDPTTLEGKPCKISLEVSVMPDKLRQQFMCSVNSKATFSPRESADSTIFATAKKDGSVEVVEFNPQQQIPFE